MVGVPPGDGVHVELLGTTGDRPDRPFPDGSVVDLADRGDLGGGPGTNLIVANEAGRLFLLRGENLRLLTRGEAARYRDKPNPFPASAP